ncbi:MAG: UDP-N-acetylmuramoyl-L-alanine--D-glutamate ligase [Pseudomonadota bacterium]
MIPVTSFADQKVAVFGLGMSGLAAARALLAGGANVACWDDGDVGRNKAQHAQLPLVDLRHANWSDYSAFVLAPGVPLTHPEPHWTVRKAKQYDVPILGDTELFFREHKKQGSQSKIIGITGTNGKSTTTALVAHILATNGYNTQMGGNIGKAVLELDLLQDDAFYVIEFSSYQIDLTPSLHPNASALLNITPDHLDRHGTLENYTAIKARIFTQLEDGDTAVIGVDDAYCQKIADNLKGKLAVHHISTEHSVDNGIYAKGGTLHVMEQGRETSQISLAGMSSLRGAHNWQNAGIAYHVLQGVGVSHDEIAKGLQSFSGLEHRMQEIARLGDVLFVNDSKATNADAASKALSSFEHIYWIVGGVAKEGGIASLTEFFPNIEKAYLIGEAADAFSHVLAEHNVAYQNYGTIEGAVAQAAKDAAQSQASEPVVLLSPACASFDQFPNFAKRGDAFCQAVKILYLDSKSNYS